MWQGPTGALALAVFATVWAHRSRAHAGVAGAWPAIAAALAMPFVLPPAWTVPRVILTVWAVTIAAKCWMLTHGGARDRAMTADPLRFALWLLLPPESTWPADALAAARVRVRAGRRLLRALAKAPGFAALLLLHWAWPPLHDHRLLESFWALWLCWLGVTAIADAVTAAPMLVFGLDLDELFDAPPLARSPRDFWGRRWNLFVHRFVTRFLFLPLGGRRHPHRATLAVFVASGLMHEYFVLGCLGRPSGYTGAMLAFFTVQGLGVVGEMRWRRRARDLPRPLAIALHLGWLTLTSPLFFAPLGEIFAGW